MKKIIIIGLILLIVVVGAYFIFFQNYKEASDQSSGANNEAQEISETAIYKIEFIADWNNQTHPNYYPENAHFSPFIAYSHDDQPSSEIFQEGFNPTPGVEEMAETGKPEMLNQEIDLFISSNLVHKRTQGQVFDSPGKVSSELEFTKDYSHLTFVSMMAPSPDWFVAGKYNLIQNGNWVDTIELDLVTYDGGGDSGATLTDPDSDTNPKEPISLSPFYLQGLGRIILTKIN